MRIKIAYAMRAALGGLKKENVRGSVKGWKE